MNAEGILTRLKASGIILRPVGDQLVVDSSAPLTEQQRQFIRQHKASILKALAATPSQPTATTGARTVAPATVVTEPWPARIEIPEPAPKDRLCYQCQHFQRSPYGFPLGRCRQHGMPEGSFSDVRGNRLQHATSQPVRFGCASFQLRAPETHLCTACRNYHPVSTMCRVVNTGCPYPAIPPCTGTHFLPKAVRS